ncbi:MAG: hypothetical protein R3Y60_04800 [bacterium]
MKFIYIILGGWIFWLIFMLLGLIFKLFGAKMSSTSFFAMASAIINTENKVNKGSITSNLILNIIFIFVGGFAYAIHALIFGLILGLFNKKLGGALISNAFGFITLCSNK